VSFYSNFIASFIALTALQNTENDTVSRNTIGRKMAATLLGEGGSSAKRCL